LKKIPENTTTGQENLDRSLVDISFQLLLELQPWCRLYGHHNSRKQGIHGVEALVRGS